LPAQVNFGTGRIAELDGLRGLAAVAVVAAHYGGEVRHGIPALTIGWWGVDLFFVLSGFLMGSIILNHHREPGFLKSFYVRRAARIIPVYFIVVAVTLFAAALTEGNAWSDQPFGAAVYLLFLPNVAMSLWGGGGDWLKPAWTLAVEEQFYLVLPLLILWIPQRFLVRALLGLFAMAVVFRCVFHQPHSFAALTLLPSRMDLLLGGVVLAHIRQHFDLSEHLQALRTVPLIAVIAMLAIALASPDLFVIFSPTLASVGFASFMLAVMLGAPEARRYRSPLLRYFGQISYALYLVHQPVSGLLHGLLLDAKPDVGTLPQIGVTILAFAVSVGVASLSWYWLEQPILRFVPGRRDGARVSHRPMHANAVRA
jgi:peptidoglycan/LPS O-acetylase OafA/YrhL